VEEKHIFSKQEVENNPSCLP
jgi:hypothetical protein